MVVRWCVCAIYYTAHLRFNHRAVPNSSRKLLKWISSRVRSERARLGLSQQEVAERADVSRRMLAAIEGEESNVSLATIDRIASGLGLTFAELLRDSPTAPPATPVVAWQGRSRASRGVLLQSAPAVRNVELWEWTLAPRDRYMAGADRKGMREQIYVIAGTLTLQVDAKVHRLGAGESLMFESDRSYEYRNEGTRAARFLKTVVE